MSVSYTHLEHHDEKQPVKENPSGSSASKDESAGKEELPKEEPSEDNSEGMFEDEDAAVSHLEMGARSKYWQPVSRWLESQGNTDIGIIYNDLLQTDFRVYSEKELRSIPRDVLYVAKNEIFARHGYIFKNKDLNYYFRGMVWYRPTTSVDVYKRQVINRDGVIWIEAFRGSFCLKGERIFSFFYHKVKHERKIKVIWSSTDFDHRDPISYDCVFSGKRRRYVSAGRQGAFQAGRKSDTESLRGNIGGGRNRKPQSAGRHCKDKPVPGS